MDLLKSYEIDECSSQELVEMLSKESLLGSDDCAVANFSIRSSNQNTTHDEMSVQFKGKTNLKTRQNNKYRTCGMSNKKIHTA